jgi:hypothetical protein
MPNAINIPKTHLIMGLSLPLAVLLGYFVAEPMELGSMAVVVFVLVALSIPLMMKWYYPFLLLSWNAAIAPVFLPGRPPLWVLVAFVGLLFAVINRAVSANERFVSEPSITKPLLVLTGVVVATGLLTGGFGVQMLGSGQYGGKRYFFFLAAVAGYFVLTSRRIPPHRVGLYLALFFLPGLTYALTDMAILGGPKYDFMFYFFAPDSALLGTALEGPTSPFAHAMRFSELSMVGTALYGYLLARYGIRGLLDLTRPWRLLFLLVALAAGLLSGFRSFVLLGALTFVILCYLEGLHRTRFLPAFLGLTLLGGAVMLPQAEKLPMMVQRSLSFLPGKFDLATREGAQGSVDWRLEMWRQVLPDVPKHLFRGKGWGIDAREFFTTIELGEAGNLAGMILAGDYHNGPLSVLMPFGIYGAIAFIWFLIAGLRVLHRNWKFGSPELRTVNTLLLAAFAARTLFFFFFFGALHSDIPVLLGLLGLSVALNGADPSLAQAEQPDTSVEFNTEYIKA